MLFFREFVEVRISEYVCVFSQFKVMLKDKSWSGSMKTFATWSSGCLDDAAEDFVR